MPFIENISASDVQNGHHRDPGRNAMLISIADPASWRPPPKHLFAEIHNFEFLDIKEDDFALDEEMRCSQAQADRLVQLLQHALDNNMNVIVHCYAGVSRSGAVAAIGTLMGFEYVGQHNPATHANSLVYDRMLFAL